MSFLINKSEVDGRELVYLTIPQFSESSMVKHCFTTRIGGVSEGVYGTLNTDFDKDDPRENVEKNLDTVCGAIGIDYRKLVLSDQIHEDVIREVKLEDQGSGVTKPMILGIDALVTNVPGVPLITYYADCVPVFILDTENRAVALIHSGWRGTVKRIAAKTLRRMSELYGTKPENCLAAIGPSIEKKCFEVGWDAAKEFVDNFKKSEEYVQKINDEKYVVDLWQVNRDMLQEEGIKPENINVSGLCTKCNPDLFFSYRRDKGKTGSLSAIIELV